MQLRRVLLAAAGLSTLALVAAGPLRAELVSGAVQSLDGARIVVDGTPYPLASPTAFETMQGHKVDPALFKSGVMVFLEIDETGHVVAVRGLIPN